MFKTYQEAFDSTVEKLAKQGRRALIKEDECAYRTESGLACGVGCHIPDGHPALRSRMNVNELINEYPEVSSFLGIEEDAAFILFWEHVQLAHDQADSVESVILRFTQVANRWNLNSESVKKFVTWSAE